MSERKCQGRLGLACSTGGDATTRLYHHRAQLALAQSTLTSTAGPRLMTLSLTKYLDDDS